MSWPLFSRLRIWESRKRGKEGAQVSVGLFWVLACILSLFPDKHFACVHSGTSAEHVHLSSGYMDHGSFGQGLLLRRIMLHIRSCFGTDVFLTYLQKPHFLGASQGNWSKLSPDKTGNATVKPVLAAHTPARTHSTSCTTPRKNPSGLGW